MKKRIISALAAILALTCVSGCSENGGLSSAADGGQGSDSSVNSTDLTSSTTSSESTSSSSGTESAVQSSSDKTESSSPEESSAPVEVSSTAGGGDISPVELTADNMLTSVRLFDVISQGKDNSMFSPLSLNMALGLLAEGAGGGSKTALDTYLGTDNYSDFANGYMQIVESLSLIHI